MDNKKNSIITKIIVIVVILLFVIILFSEKIYWGITDLKYRIKYSLNADKTLGILSSSENKDLEDVIVDYAKTKGYDVYFTYDGSLDIIQGLNNGENSYYDGIWLSNSIWMYMLDSNINTSDSKCTSINPVIFGVKKSKAEELGFTNKTVYTKDILQAISDGKLKFSMSNPTSTDSGASAYLGMLYTLAGNPEVLTKENLQDKDLKEKLTTLYSGMERSSGSEDFLEELFLNGEYEAVVTYESSIININKQLVEEGKEPLYAIYPVDGVSISDSPLAFFDNGFNSDRKEIFDDIQSYILSNEGQKKLQEKGRRTWFGGISENVDKTVFNPDWGIDTTKYITPVKYPSKDVIKLALNLYQVELKKPTHVVFCLDYSGSMMGEGYRELVESMEYILTEKASEDFIQFSDKDKISIIPFGTAVKGVWSTDNGNNTTELLNKIKTLSPTGSTALYPAAIKALELLKDEDTEKYNVSIVLMTDGLANVGTFDNLETYYQKVNKNIPIYSITFGKASESQLYKISALSNAKVFDGKYDLVKAFKEVRGYN